MSRSRGRKTKPRRSLPPGPYRSLVRSRTDGRFPLGRPSSAASSPAPSWGSVRSRTDAFPLLGVSVVRVRPLPCYRGRGFAGRRWPPASRRRTNWCAELAIRFGVILRKVWGGSHTWAGARAQSVLMSVWRTCWQQGRSALELLSQALRAFGNPLLARPILLTLR